MKLVRPVEMCLNETYNKLCTGKHFSAAFPIQNGLNKEMLNHHITTQENKEGLKFVGV
jgi:hypothetical protein